MPFGVNMKELCKIINYIKKGFLRYRSHKDKSKAVTRCPRSSMTAAIRKASQSASGSITVEAAAVLGMFLIMCGAVISLFAVLNSQIKTEYRLYLAAEKCAAAGIADTIFADEDDEGSGDINLSAFGNGITVSDSDIIIESTYPEKIPFFGEIIKPFVITKKVCLRAWVGRTLSDETDDPDDIYVFITENGSVYHTDENCPHLSIKTTCVSREEALTMRNSDGGRFYPCETCGGAGDHVYITEYGDRFHMKYCPDINREYKKVKLSEISLPLCSRCEYGKQKVNVKETG